MKIILFVKSSLSLLYKKIRIILGAHALTHILDELAAKETLLGMALIPGIIFHTVPPILSLKLIPYVEKELALAINNGFSSDPFSKLGHLFDNI